MGISSTSEMIIWSLASADPNKLLIKGNTYLVNKSEVLADGYSTLHRIEVIGVEGRFNADCFERALGCIRQAQPNEG